MSRGVASDTGTSVSALGADVASAACAKTLPPDTRFYVPPPSVGAPEQFAALLKMKAFGDAAHVAELESVARGVWFVGGTPDEVNVAVRKTMHRAAREHRVPILVAYNLPFRDCAQYSGGGAIDTAAYAAWIDAFASGIGGGKAIVILEPDGLGIIPYNKTIFGAADWCKPTVTDAAGNTVAAPGATPAARYAQLNHAVDSLATQAPGALVYLDGTHSAWLGVSEAAYRLSQAGVARARGFFLDASNYQPTAELTRFGTWVSDCITAATAGVPWAAGHFDWCPSQYNPATGFGLDYSDAYAATVTAGLEGLMGGAPATTPFVLDTGRNGRGPFNASPYAAAPYNQPAAAIGGLNAGNWCNPFGAGLGLRTTADTGVPLLDAYLWIKVPGESDGSCDIAGGARGWDFSQYNPWGIAPDAQNHFDPLWGMVDPAAGQWFPEQVLQLTQNADPPLFP